MGRARSRASTAPEVQHTPPNSKKQYTSQSPRCQMDWQPSGRLLAAAARDAFTANSTTRFLPWLGAVLTALAPARAGCLFSVLAVAVTLSQAKGLAVGTTKQQRPRRDSSGRRGDPQNDNAKHVRRGGSVEMIVCELHTRRCCRRRRGGLGRPPRGLGGAVAASGSFVYARRPGKAAARFGGQLLRAARWSMRGGLGRPPRGVWTSCRRRHRSRRYRKRGPGRVVEGICLHSAGGVSTLRPLPRGVLPTFTA